MSAPRCRRVVRAVAAGTIAALAGCASGGAASPVAGTTASATAQPDPAAGLELADRNCSLCHAVTIGAASRDPRAPTFARLARTYPLGAVREGLASGGVIGHRGMPQIQLEPRQIDDLIAYLRSLQPQKP